MNMISIKVALLFIIYIINSIDFVIISIIGVLRRDAGVERQVRGVRD